MYHVSDYALSLITKQRQDDNLRAAEQIRLANIARGQDNSSIMTRLQEQVNNWLSEPEHLEDTLTENEHILANFLDMSPEELLGIVRTHDKSNLMVRLKERVNNWLNAPEHSAHEPIENDIILSKYLNLSPEELIKYEAKRRFYESLMTGHALAEVEELDIKERWYADHAINA